MNKILATQALELVGELAIAMGPQTRVQIPQLLPCVLAALADSKNTVRAAARATLNTMVKETSLKDMFVNEIVSTAVAKVSWCNFAFPQSAYWAMIPPTYFDLYIKDKGLRIFLLYKALWEKATMLVQCILVMNL